MYGTNAVREGLVMCIGSAAFVEVERHKSKGDLSTSTEMSPTGPSPLLLATIREPEHSKYVGIVANVGLTTVTLAFAHRVSSCDLSVPSWCIAADSPQSPCFITLETKKIRNVDCLPSEMWPAVISNYRRMRRTPFHEDDEVPTFSSSMNTSSGFSPTNNHASAAVVVNRGLVTFTLRLGLRHALSRPTTLGALKSFVASTTAARQQEVGPSSFASPNSSEPIDTSASEASTSGVEPSSPITDVWLHRVFRRDGTVANNDSGNSLGSTTSLDVEGHHLSEVDAMLSVAEAWASSIAAGANGERNPCELQQCALGVVAALQHCRETGPDGTEFTGLLKLVQQEALVLVDVVRERVLGADDSDSWLAEASAAIVAEANERHTSCLSNLWTLVAALLALIGSASQIIWHLFQQTAGRQIVTQLFDFSWWLYISTSTLLLLTAFHSFIFASEGLKKRHRRIQSGLEVLIAVCGLPVLVFAWCVLVNNEAIVPGVGSQRLAEFWLARAERGSGAVCEFMMQNDCSGYMIPCVTRAEAANASGGKVTPQFILSNRTECSLVKDCFMRTYLDDATSNGAASAAGLGSSTPTPTTGDTAFQQLLSHIPRKACFSAFRNDARTVAGTVVAVYLAFICVCLTRVLAQMQFDKDYDDELDATLGPYRWQPNVRGAEASPTASTAVVPDTSPPTLVNASPSG